MAEAPPPTQVEIFAGGEGDRWFRRNRVALHLTDPEGDMPMRLMDLYDLRPRQVIEIGSSNGYRLASIARRHACRVVGIDPSKEAVADGRERFPEVELYVGRADHLPVTETFDLVIVNFVLHWVDRALLLATVAELDRVVADGGYLIIGDFHGGRPTRRRYHHLPEQGVYTYKQDYADIFKATMCYEEVAALTGSHNQSRLVADVPDVERTATWLLRKRLHDLYHDADAEAPVPVS